MTMRAIVVILIALVTPVLAADVTYFPAEKVSAAFAKGAVLFDGDGRNYMVHASRRDGAGQAEVHVKLLNGSKSTMLRLGPFKVTPTTALKGDLKALLGPQALAS